MPSRRVPVVLLLTLTLALALASSACKGSSSPSPSGPSPTDASADTVIAGVLLETVSRAPVAGALVETSSGSVRTDAGGSFRLPASGAALSVNVTVSAPGHATRRTSLPASAAASASAGAAVTLDVIETGSLWNLDFYRELARNGAGGGSLAALNPWTVEPRVYVDRRPETGSGREIPDLSVDTVRSAVSAVLPLLTNGRLRGDRIEIGTDPPADATPGTVVIRWDPVEIARSTGAASGITRGVGGNASVVILRSIEETGVIYHELGHVLGLYHPLGGYRPSLMSGSGTAAPPFFTDWDVFHARIVYARPPGNTDVDNDPAGYVLGARPLRARNAPGITIVCRFD